MKAGVFLQSENFAENLTTRTVVQSYSPESAWVKGRVRRPVSLPVGGLGDEKTTTISHQGYTAVPMGQGGPPPMAVAAAVPMGGGGAAPVAAAVPMQQQAGYGGGAPAVAVAQPGYGAPAVAVAQPGYGAPAVAVAQPGYGAPPVATATAMPMGGGGAAPTMVMQKQQMRPSGGIDFLAQFGDLYIAQQVEMFEAFTGFETANMYHILGPGGPIMVAAEQSECCERQCCGSVRSFTMQLAMLGPQGQSNGMPVISYVRPLRCKPPQCCCMLQEMDVYAGPAGSVQVGRLSQVYSCCGSEIDVIVNGQLTYRISGPACVCDGPCCGEQEFYVNTPNGTQIPTPAGPARITKKMGEFVQEMMTDADNFGCTFPQDATPQAKAVLLGAVFLIDFLFFEDGGAAEGGFHDD